MSGVEYLIYVKRSDGQIEPLASTYCLQEATNLVRFLNEGFGMNSTYYCCEAPEKKENFGRKVISEVFVT